ncbi:MAG: GerMN domain-containing protein [Acidimicrobiales bacterium]
MTAPRRTAVAAAVVVAAVALSACGVPVDRAPTALPRKGVPFGLLRPSSSSSTATSVVSPLESQVQIFLVTSSGHLAPVLRRVRTTEESLTAVLGALVRGPSNVEAAAGLASAVPPQTNVLGASIGTDQVATIDLGGTFGQLVGQAQIEAVAQIVFTATALPGVSGVTFELSGQPVEVPVASGALVPVADSSQFAALAPAATSGATGG